MILLYLKNQTRFLLSEFCEVIAGICYNIIEGGARTVNVNRKIIFCASFIAMLALCTWLTLKIGGMF